MSKLRSSILGWPDWVAPDNSLSFEAQAKIRELTQRYQTLTEEARQGLLPWESAPAVDARLKELEQENARLKKMYADAQLRAEVVQEALAKK